MRHSTAPDAPARPRLLYCEENGTDREGVVLHYEGKRVRTALKRELTAEERQDIIEYFLR